MSAVWGCLILAVVCVILVHLTDLIRAKSPDYNNRQLSDEEFFKLNRLFYRRLVFRNVAGAICGLGAMLSIAAAAVCGFWVPCPSTGNLVASFIFQEDLARSVKGGAKVTRVIAEAGIVGMRVRIYFANY